MSARRARLIPWRAKRQHNFSALTPLPELVTQLNAFQPVMLGGYPSALELLARRSRAAATATAQWQILPRLVRSEGR